MEYADGALTEKLDDDDEAYVHSEGGAVMKIEVKKLSRGELEKRGVFSWPIWEKEVSRFDWHYDDREECYFLSGRVVLETKDGERLTFGKDDLVSFPQGLSCVWDIKEPVRKHYRFGP